jgi:hypothetical protein
MSIIVWDEKKQRNFYTGSLLVVVKVRVQRGGSGWRVGRVVDLFHSTRWKKGYDVSGTGGENVLWDGVGTALDGKDLPVCWRRINSMYAERWRERRTACHISLSIHPIIPSTVFSASMERPYCGPVAAAVPGLKQC